MAMSLTKLLSASETALGVWFSDDRSPHCAGCLPMGYRAGGPSPTGEGAVSFPWKGLSGGEKTPHFHSGVFYVRGIPKGPNKNKSFDGNLSYMPSQKLGI